MYRIKKRIRKFKKFEKKEAVQDAILNSSQEIKDLKLSVSELRSELENLKI